MALVKVGLAQINPCVGDMKANAARILKAAVWAREQHVDLLITPELALIGSPAADLFLRETFVQQIEEAFSQLCKDLTALGGNLSVLVGHVVREQGALYNVISVLVSGRLEARYYKHRLAGGGQPENGQHLTTDSEATVFECKGLRFGISHSGLASQTDTLIQSAQSAAGVQVWLVPDSSAYQQDRPRLRQKQLRARLPGVTAVYVNQTGGQDELVFDGASFVLDAQGDVSLRLPLFQEAYGIVQLDAGASPVQSQYFDSSGASKPVLLSWPSVLEQVYGALKLALADYLQKTGFSNVLLGLSGGLDSALVLAVAVDALGADRVRTLMMPSPYTADISLADAREMAHTLGVAHDVIAIGPLAKGFDDALAPLFVGYEPDVTEENIQARIRGILLMAASNKFNALVVGTGNKSELATGYSTLYGDMVGGFALLKDVPKTMVYALARWRNERAPVIPLRIITRPPSAELRADQTDQDSLPPYDVLDDIIERYVELNQPAAQIIKAGHTPQIVAQVIRLIRVNEYKRRQGAVGPRISVRSFGSEWCMPIANGFRDEPQIPQ